MPRKTNPSSNLLPIILIASGMAVIFGILIWQLVNQAPSSESTQTANANIPYAKVQRVNLADAKAALENKTAVFVDVRDLDFYNISHITGAVNIPLGELETRLRELDPNQWIITYCT